MPPSGDVAVVIPANNESDRIQATVAGATGLPGVDLVVVVDDGSTDDTAALAGDAGATVVRHSRRRGKAAAMETGAEAIRLVETTTAPGGPGPARHLLFLDGDLGATAAEAGPLIEPVRAGQADMTIAVFTDRVKQGGHGFVVGLSGAGIERVTGWRPAQPLNGQRCLTRAAFPAARTRLRGRDGAHHRPAPPRHAGDRGGGTAVPPGHRKRLAGAVAPGQAVRRRRPRARGPHRQA